MGATHHIPHVWGIGTKMWGMQEKSGDWGMTLEMWGKLPLRVYEIIAYSMMYSGACARKCGAKAFFIFY